MYIPQFERGQFGDVKRAKWKGKVVAVKCFTSADRKGGFSEEVDYFIVNCQIIITVLSFP